MKTLGMDLGTRTLGLATSDRTGLISSPYKTIHYEDINALADEVVKLIAELKIEDLVLGLPKNMNNTFGTAVERSMVFKKILEERFIIGKTQMEVSQEIGISQAQVSRLEKCALKKIKS